MDMRKSIAGLMLAASLLAAGCGLYQKDKAWVSEEKYTQASALFDTTGSLALTEKSLRENPTWLDAEINEALYRLKKERNLEQTNSP